MLASSWTKISNTSVNGCWKLEKHVIFSKGFDGLEDARSVCTRSGLVSTAFSNLDEITFSSSVVFTHVRFKKIWTRALSSCFISVFFYLLNSVWSGIQMNVVQTLSICNLDLVLSAIQVRIEAYDGFTFTFSWPNIKLLGYS